MVCQKVLGLSKWLGYNSHAKLRQRASLQWVGVTKKGLFSDSSCSQFSSPAVTNSKLIRRKCKAPCKRTYRLTVRQGAFLPEIQKWSWLYIDFQSLYAI